MSIDRGSARGEESGSAQRGRAFAGGESSARAVAGGVRAARAPRPARDLRVLVVGAGPARVTVASALPEELRPGDLLVVNDAATLPASLRGMTVARRTRRDAPIEAGASVELRLTGRVDGDDFGAVVLGAGDHRTPTEARSAPPALEVGDRVALAGVVAVITSVSPFSRRLVSVRFEGAPADLWTALYRAGRPVQYAHVPDALGLWDVQNAYASRPWAVEPPSAGRALAPSTLIELRRTGVEVARITHAAGLSSTGDPEIDARLPLPERYEVPLETAAAVARTRARGGRVVAVGTSTVRALESAARGTGGVGLRVGVDETDLVLGPGATLAVVDGVVTGVHDVETSHFALLAAFADPAVLARAWDVAAAEELLGHEFGDVALVWRTPRGPVDT